MTTSILSRVRAWFQQGNRSTWTVFFLFACVLFAKTMIFHWTCFHFIAFSSIVHDPKAFFVFWMGKIVPVLFLSSFVLLTKKKYWTIIILVLLDCWILSNLMYYKANSTFFTYDMLFVVDNMQGFWSSLLVLLDWDVYSILLLTIGYILGMCLLQIWRTPKRLYCGSAILVLSIIIAMTNNVLSYSANKHTYKYIYAFSTYHLYLYSVNIRWINTGSIYTQYQSIISWFPAMLTFQIIKNHYANDITIAFSEKDKQKIKTIIRPSCTIKPTNNIIIVLVESLESWVLQPVTNYDYMPNLTKLTRETHIMNCTHIHSQVKHGVSADGQMLLVSGMLPINEGATCILYGRNDFATYASLYPASATFNPSPGTWEQTTMSNTYHFSQLIEPRYNEKWGDKEVLDTMTQWCLQQDSMFCALGITISSHIPFTYGKTHVAYAPYGMPERMVDYLNCLHYADSCIGALLDTVLQSPLAENTVIVITGDHTIFKNARTYADLTAYAQENHIDFEAGNTFTPLIIYSPSIEGNIQITDTCYQMDIFPTILPLIGAEDFYWQGFGVNLLDSAAIRNRSLSEQEAYRLSDMMIRNDYFRKRETD